MHASPPAGAARDTQASGLRETERRELASLLPPLSLLLLRRFAAPSRAARRPIALRVVAAGRHCCCQRGEAPVSV